MAWIRTTPCSASTRTPASERLMMSRCGPVVDVFDANDVVIAKMAAALHFDHLKLALAWILQTVNHPGREMDRFVLVNGLHLAADRHGGGAAHHNPVPGAV